METMYDHAIHVLGRGRVDKILVQAILEADPFPQDQEVFLCDELGLDWEKELS